MINEGQRFTVCWLLHKDGENPTLEHLVTMYQQDKAFFASAVKVLGKLQYGVNHSMPYTRPLKGKNAKGLYEARVLGGKRRQLARFPFIYTGSSEVVLLYGFTKDDGQAPPKFVERAKLYKELLEEGTLSYEETDLTQF